MRESLLVFCLICTSLSVFSQNLKYLDYDILSNGDTIFSDDLNEILVFDFNNDDEKRYYILLKRKVKKVFPYALKAKEILSEIEDSSLQTKEKEKEGNLYAKK